MLKRLRIMVEQYLSAGRRFLQYRRPNLERRLAQIAQWFESEQGARVLAAQRSIIDQSISRCFGYHLLQMSVGPSNHLFSECRVQRQYRYHLQADNKLRLKPLVVGDYEQLPFESDSIDVIVLHHIPEFCDNPHQLLREVYRVLAPYGHLVVVGFNPWSPRWFLSRISRHLTASPWHNRLISGVKFSDWLSVLGFDIAACRYGYTANGGVKSSVQGWWPLLENIPLGSFYVISAKKQQATMTPIKPRWTVQKNRFSGLSPAKSRTVHDSPRRDNNAAKSV